MECRLELSELAVELNTTQEDLLNPRPERVSKMYVKVLRELTGRDLDSNIGLFWEIRRVLQMIGSESLGLADLTSPECARTIKILSFLVTFLKFKREQENELGRHKGEDITEYAKELSELALIRAEVEELKETQTGTRTLDIEQLKEIEFLKNHLTEESERKTEIDRQLGVLETENSHCEYFLKRLGKEICPGNRTPFDSQLSERRKAAETSVELSISIEERDQQLNRVRSEVSALQSDLLRVGTEEATSLPLKLQEFAAANSELHFQISTLTVELEKSLKSQSTLEAEQENRESLYSSELESLSKEHSKMIEKADYYKSQVFSLLKDSEFLSTHKENLN